jgi:LPS-assembly lipoprotein
MWSFEQEGSAVGNRQSAIGRLPIADLPTAALKRVAVVFLALSSLALAGCNIEPLYGPIGAGAPLKAELEAVAIDPIPDRLGHYVRNELIFGFNGTGSTVSPRYRLAVVLRERVQTPILDTVTTRATSATVIVDADYRLTSIPDGLEVTKGSALAVASYDRFSNRLANVRAARDSEIRDAKAIAEQIRTRVSIALAERR